MQKRSLTFYAISFSVIITSVAVFNYVIAATGLNLGYPYGTLLNNANENVIYGVASTTGLTGNLIKMQTYDGSTYANKFVVDKDGSVSALEYCDLNGLNCFSKADVSEGYWKLSGNNLYASTTSWNVGIGSSTPDAKLAIKAAPGQALLNIASSTGASKFYISAQRGRVGIGKPNPKALLHLGGEISGPYTLENNGLAFADGNMGFYPHGGSGALRLKFSDRKWTSFFFRRHFIGRAYWSNIY